MVEGSLMLSEFRISDLNYDNNVTFLVKKHNKVSLVIISRAPLRVHVSQADGRLLYWMYTLWVVLPMAELVVIVTARSLGRPPRGQWLPIRGQTW